MCARESERTVVKRAQMGCTECDWTIGVVFDISDCDEKKEKGEMLIRDCVSISRDKCNECWALESCRMEEYVCV